VARKEYSKPIETDIGEDSGQIATLEDACVRVGRMYRCSQTKKVTYEEQNSGSSCCS